MRLYEIYRTIYNRQENIINIRNEIRQNCLFDCWEYHYAACPFCTVHIKKRLYEKRIENYLIENMSYRMQAIQSIEM